ncbi:MAG: hypothetical protein M3125_08775, partial [Gemmatimonadota bacterium]|nr:hypothetical protein [Gemmatimonadota bacterium]
EAADLVNLFRAHGTEVHVATSDFTTGAAADTTKKDSTAAKPKAPARVNVKAGDWIVRLDQPYTQTVRTLLAIQKYKADDPSPYDDTGWTLDELRHVVTHKVADSAILAKPMQMLTADAKVEGSISGAGNVILVEHLGDWRSAVLPWKVGNARVSAAEMAFDAAGRSWPAGTFIVTDARGGRGRAAVRELGLTGVAVGSAPAVRAHEVRPPRVALVHSWLETQNEGWVRYALDQLGVPYTYISDQSLATPRRLEAFDVLVFPHVSGSVQSLINGRPKTGPPIPWRKTALTPNLDKWDTTDDIRRGMGLDGAAALRAFVDRGGVLITTGNTSRLPLTLGFNPSVSEEEPRTLRTRGAIFRARADTTGSPILYGYERKIFPVYFNRTPLLEVQARDTSGRLDAVDPAIVADIDRQRGRVILSYHNKADSLLVSGLLVNGSEMAGKAAVVDAPVGRGHVVLFGICPMWRWQTQGTFALILNAMANWEHLGVTTTPEKPTVAEAQ